MKNIISIKNLSFFYDNKIIFDDLNLDIEEGKWITLIGNNGSGKSTLIKLILGLYKFDGKILVDDLDVLKDIKEIRKKIGVVFPDPNYNFVLDSVDDELEFSLRNLNLSETTIKKRKLKIINNLNLNRFINSNPKDLSGGEKQLVALATALIINPKILILDESLEMLDFKQKENVLKVIKEYYKEGMTVINITQNIDDTLLGGDVIVMDSGKVILNGSKTEVFSNEKTFKELGLELPFIVDLSIKLKYYGLIDKFYFNMEELVDDIWK